MTAHRGGPPRHISAALPFDGTAAGALARARTLAGALEPAPEPDRPPATAPLREGPALVPAPTAPQHEPKRCGCGAAIFWAQTEAGRSMPVDAEPTPDGNVVLYDRGGSVCARVLKKGEEPGPLEKRRRPHWMTCPNAAQHRRPR